jgi:hypothetical protein
VLLNEASSTPLPPGCHHRVLNIHWCSLPGVAEVCVVALTLTGAEAVE